MKITVAKRDLESTLAASIGIGSSGSDLSTHYLFRVRDGKVEVLTSNLRILSACPLSCQHDGNDGDAFTIEGWRLQKWLSGVGDVAVTIEKDGSEVKASSPRSTVRMASLDPSKFPYWDKTLEAAETIVEMDATRLSDALGYVRLFINEKGDENKPEIAQTEAISGSLWATDNRAVTLVSMPCMEDSKLRLHWKDISSIQKFLSQRDTAKVTILEHEKTTFFRREDGALAGAMRPLNEFPVLTVDKNHQSPASWEIRTADLLSGIQCLSASADKDNTWVKFVYDADADKVNLSVLASAGGEDTYPMDCLSQENAKDIPEFWLNHKHLTNIIGHFGNDTLTFGLTKHGRSGYTTFRHTLHGDLYHTALVWRL